MPRVESPRPATDVAARRYDVMALHHVAHSVPMSDSHAKPVTSSAAEHSQEDTRNLWKKECALWKPKSKS